MKLSSLPQSDGTGPLASAYTFETETAAYFEAQLLTDEMEDSLEDVYPLTFRVAVQDQTSAIVSLLYESRSSKPLPLNIILDQAVNIADPSLQNFSFASSSEAVEFEFEPVENGSKILSVQEESHAESVNIGLVVATSILSVMLLIVSAVLLHVSGGWKVCKRKITNCLFEEVDDDDFVGVTKINTYPAHKSFDEESSMVSPDPTSASGFLGARNNPAAAGLGIKTHDVDEDSSMMYGDSETPASQATTPAPLGITSMNKPESPSPRRGLSSMVMKRFGTGSAGKNL